MSGALLGNSGGVRGLGRSKNKERNAALNKTRVKLDERGGEGGSRSG